jgi:hypothetical protein
MLTKDPKTEHKRRVAPATAKRQPRARPPELPKLVKPDGAGARWPTVANFIRSHHRHPYRQHPYRHHRAVVGRRDRPCQCVRPCRC